MRTFFERGRAVAALAWIAAATAAIPAAAQDAPAAGVAASSGPPLDLSVQAMFANAGPLVQGVMGLLLLASLLTWTVLVAKGVELLSGQNRLRRAIREAEIRLSFNDLRTELSGAGVAAVMMEAAAAELVLSHNLPAANTRDRIAARLRRIEATWGRRMSRGTGLLATVGATAPFVGLFGTVWGIMNSFVGIARLHTTNIAVIAPGIAEALLATATGLIAAIPAVVIYNLFARGIANYRAGLGDLSGAIQLLVSRELDAPRRLRAAAE